MSNPITLAVEKEVSRVTSAENLVSFVYGEASSTVTGATVTVSSVSEVAEADVTIVFATQGQVKSKAITGPFKCENVCDALVETLAFKGALKTTMIAPGNNTKVIIVGLGNVIDGHSSATHYLFSDQLRQAVHAGIEAAKGLKAQSVSIVIPSVKVNASDSVELGCGEGIKVEAPKDDAPATPVGTPCDEVDSEEVSSLVVRTAVLANHAFDKYLKEESPLVKQINIVGSITDANLLKNVAVAESVMVTREVGNDRADVVTPAYMQNMAEKLAAAFPDTVKLRVLQYDELIANGYNLLSAVGQAAVVPPRLVAIEYKNADLPAPLGFVGKGITFDTGGLNLKPTGFMEDMHMDMCGSAAVLGAMRAIATAGLKTHVVGVMTLAENAMDAKSYKPHAIIRSHVGSINISNTDAEGRLALGDALTFIQDTYKPAKIVDLATLTGAMVISTGEYAAGLFTNSNKFATQIQEASQSGYERLWRMPIFRESHTELKGSQSDFNSTGGSRYGGSCTAAAFLEKFIQPNVAWCHLDIAGSASYSVKRDYLPKGATGYGVQTLFNLASNHN